MESGPIRSPGVRTEGSWFVSARRESQEPGPRSPGPRVIVAIPVGGVLTEGDRSRKPGPGGNCGDSDQREARPEAIGLPFWIRGGGIGERRTAFVSRSKRPPASDSTGRTSTTPPAWTHRGRTQHCRTASERPSLLARPDFDRSAPAHSPGTERKHSRQAVAECLEGLAVQRSKCAIHQ